MMDLIQKLLGAKIDQDYGGSQFNPQNTGNSEGSSSYEPQQSTNSWIDPYGANSNFSSMMEKLKQDRKRRMNPAPSAVGPVMSGRPGAPQVHPLRQLLNNMIGPR